MQNFFIALNLYKKIIGKVKIVITIKLNANKPTKFKVWSISVDQERLYAHKFQGNPVNSFDFKKSENAIAPEKIKIDEKLWFKKGPISKVTKPVNKLKNIGMSINAKGIKILKFSSKVKELVIHETPLK